MNGFGKRIRQLRIEKGMSLQCLGKVLNMSRQNLDMFEIGENYPSLKTALMLANYFNVSLDYLVGRTSNRYMDENYYTSKKQSLEKELEALTVKINNSYSDNIGMKIRVKRVERKLTLQELSKISGVNRSTLSKIENNKAGTEKTIGKILRALEDMPKEGE